MNHAQPTPGYPTRVQIVFTLRDGVSCAWLVTQLDGQGLLVSMPFELAKGFVEKDQADEYLGPVPSRYGRALPLTSLESSAPGCGCGSPKARSPRGRLVRVEETVIGEPLFAVADGPAGGDGVKVACCGEECAGELAEGTPQGIRFDRYAVAEDGGYELRDSVQAPFPLPLVDLYGQRVPACLPWVRISRDPRRFKQCLARAKAIGPMNNVGAVQKLIGPFMEKEDQEVFLAILVDSQMHVRGIAEIARGSRTQTVVSIPDTLRVALVEGAIALIVVNNHPSGVTRPSEADEQFTAAMRDAAKTVKLDLIDHVIVGAGAKPYSFLDHKNQL